MLALLLGRAWLVARIYGPFAGCHGCMFGASAMSDSWLVLFALLLLIPANFGITWLRALCTLPVLLLALVMALDVALLLSLNTRMYVFDLLKFGGEAGATFDFVRVLMRSSYAIPAITCVIWLLASLLSLLPERARPQRQITLLTGSVLALLVALCEPLVAPGYVHADGYRNALSVQWNDGSNTPYSDSFLDRQRAIAELPPRCLAGQSVRPDVILLMIESLSSYHSALLGSPRNDVPELDALAEQHRYFTQFMANGFTTDMGMIALLSGELPVRSIGRRSSLHAFAGFGDQQHAVPLLLDQSGYYSAFFTTGNLSFLDKRPWLESLGFDHVEGHEARYYDGMPRFTFGAAEDSALYGRFLEWMERWRLRDSTTPLFASLLTVESHPPYVDHSTGKLDESGIIRRVDRAAAAFEKNLRASGYFDRGGILLITGDHRTMTALHPEEAAEGDRAFARIPLVAVGPPGWDGSRVDGLFQQTDLLPSLAQLTLPQACGAPGSGFLLADGPVPAQWVLHARGDQRDRVDFYSDTVNAWLELDGDASRWHGTMTPLTGAIAADIHLSRARRGEARNDLPTILRLIDGADQRTSESDKAGQ
ncbi:MAG: LTA synthase family protein [Lysobacteraceae bacterium]